MSPTFMLDTDTISYALRGYGRVMERVRQYRPSDLCVSSISVAELRYGAEKRQATKTHRAISGFLHDIPILAFDESAADRFAVVATTVARAGQPIGNLDFLIAAHALSVGVTLVTNNLRHFERVPGLSYETWV